MFGSRRGCIQSCLNFQRLESLPLQSAPCWRRQPTFLRQMLIKHAKEGSKLIEVILGLYWGYIGIMEKTMENALMD